MKYNIANPDERIIIITLNKPMPPLSIDLGSLMPIRAINITNVNNTAMWAIILFSFFIPKEQNSNITPNTTGIRAVVEEVSIYPHIPNIINVKLFIKLALYAFID